MNKKILVLASQFLLVVSAASASPQGQNQRPNTQSGSQQSPNEVFRRDLSLTGNQQPLGIATHNDFLMPDGCTTQEDGVANSRRRGARGLSLLCERAGDRQDQQKRPSTMKHTHCFSNPIS